MEGSAGSSDEVKNSREATNPSRQWETLGALTALAMTSYLTRANISVASEMMGADLRLNHVQMGEVFSSFLAGYRLELVGGSIGDHPRRAATLGIFAFLCQLERRLPRLFLHLL